MLYLFSKFYGTSIKFSFIPGYYASDSVGLNFSRFTEYKKGGWYLS